MAEFKPECEFKPNSHKSKEDKTIPEREKKVNKVISGKAIIRKKSGFQEIKDSFLNTDLPNIKNYIISDVIVPTIKTALSEIGHNALDMFLYGEPRHSTRNSIVSRVPYGRNYNNITNLNARDVPMNSASRVTRYGFGDVIVPTYGEAQDVLTSLQELIVQYGTASVADLLDTLGQTGNYTDNKYGWENLNTAKIIPVRDGFLVKLPNPYPIN